MTTRQIVRKATRHGLAISTIHPTYGELHRGTVTQQQPTEPGQIHGTWHVQDQDGCEVATTTGNYVEAERVLLDATTWADEPA